MMLFLLMYGELNRNGEYKLLEGRGIFQAMSGACCLEKEKLENEKKCKKLRPNVGTLFCSWDANRTQCVLVLMMQIITILTSV
jgi:hypothetical protein